MYKNVYENFWRMRRCMDNSFEPALYMLWTSWRTFSETVCRPPQQESAGVHKPVARYQEMLCTVLWAKWFQHCKIEWINQGKELLHSTNKKQGYMPHQCIICRLHVCYRMEGKEWLALTFVCSERSDAYYCYNIQVSKNVIKRISIRPHVRFTKYEQKLFWKSLTSQIL